jgi:hypothetical protein
MLFQFRSDNMANLSDVALWLQGSNSLNGSSVPSPSFNGLLSFQTARIQFMQPGMPRTVANSYGFEFAPRINPDSSMAMGFVDQQTDSSGPPQIVTFVGNSSAKLTDAKPGDYFDNGSIAHFSQRDPGSVPGPARAQPRRSRREVISVAVAGEPHKGLG